ncbi:hypothetical protein CHUAL_014146 [Chamberlinius hualienensis]
MGKQSDLTEFQRGMIVGARLAGASISTTASLLKLSRTSVTRIHQEWREKQKTCSNRKSCGRKKIVDERAEKKLARIAQDNKKATTKQIADQFNSGEAKAISEHTVNRVLSRMGYRTKRPPGTAKSKVKKISESAAVATAGPSPSVKPDHLLQEKGYHNQMGHTVNPMHNNISKVPMIGDRMPQQQMNTVLQPNLARGSLHADRMPQHMNLPQTANLVPYNIAKGPIGGYMYN